MNVKQIAIAHLKSIGADGLCCDGCGCGLDDLMPCGWERDVSECVPAKRHACTMPKGSECPDCKGIRGETIGMGD